MIAFHNDVTAWRRRRPADLLRQLRLAKHHRRVHLRLVCACAVSVGGIVAAVPHATRMNNQDWLARAFESTSIDSARTAVTKRLGRGSSMRLVRSTLFALPIVCAEDGVDVGVVLRCLSSVPAGSGVYRPLVYSFLYSKETLIDVVVRPASTAWLHSDEQRSRRGNFAACEFRRGEALSPCTPTRSAREQTEYVIISRHAGVEQALASGRFADTLIVSW